MRICLAFILLTVFINVSKGKEIEAVVYNGISLNKNNGNVSLRNSPGAPLGKEYFIKCHYYWPDQKTVEKFLAKSNKIKFTQWREKNSQYRSFIDETFLENLRKAKLLYIGQYNEQSYQIFDKYPKEISTFLSQGGVIFFDYLGGVYPGLNKFLNSIDVKNPCPDWKTYKKDFAVGSYVVEVNPACKPLAVTKPPLGKKCSTYGWWTSWSNKQIVPFQNSKYPGKSASMIIQEKVLGNGKIIFNSIACIFRAPIAGGNKKLLQNMLSYIIDKNILDYKKEMLERQGGPGEPAM